MENIKNTTTQNKPESPRRSPSRSPVSLNEQSLSFVINSTPFLHDFQARHVHPRFGITPQSMGLERRSNVPVPAQQHQQKPQTATSRVDVKSSEKQYYKQSIVGGDVPTYSKQDSTMQQQAIPSTLQASPTNLTTFKNSPFDLQSSPPLNTSINSPPCSSIQQWNFPDTLKQDTTQECGNINNLSKNSQTVETNLYNLGYTTCEQPNTSLPTVQPTDVAPAVSQQCSHPSHAALKNVSSLSEIPTSHFEQKLQKYRSGSDVSLGDNTRLSGELNEVFLKRLQDIDANAYGDTNLKLVTYQEWVDMLLKVNESILTNIEELEAEVAERLQHLQHKVNLNCRHSQGTELMKSRKDVVALIKFITNYCQYDKQHLQNQNFETITAAQLLELTEQNSDVMSAETGAAIYTQMRSPSDAESLNKSKLSANMRALAFEVAEKHDEVRELKRSVISMEDEIQKAQKKLLLKEDVIKELRNELKCAHNKLSSRSGSLEGNLTMPPINLESRTSRSASTQSDCNTLTFQDDSYSHFDSLSHTEHEEHQKLKLLEEELNEFFAMNKECSEHHRHKMEDQYKRFMEFLKRMENEKAAAHRKLDYIRNQLIDLESLSSEVVNDSDSGFHPKSENDKETKILDTVRKRLRQLNDNNYDLNTRVQKLEFENRDLSTSLKSEKTFSERNSQTLKQLADLLSEMSNEQFSYVGIYNNTQTGMNPFCKAIMDIKENFQERELQLLETVDNSNKKINELSQVLQSYKSNFKEQQLANENIIDLEHLNKTTLPPRTPPPPIPSSTAAASTATTLLTGTPDNNQEHQTTTDLQGFNKN